jgi:hypothetical protein
VPAWLRQNALDVAAFIWGVAEATLFFFVPDVLLSYIGLRRGTKLALRASIIAAVGAGCGGVIMYLWSTNDPAMARKAVLAVPAISEAMAQRAEQAMAGNWFLATVLGRFTSTPFKARHPRAARWRIAPSIRARRYRGALATLPDRLDRRLADWPLLEPFAQRTAADLGLHRRMALILRGIFHPNAELTQP